MGLAGYAAVVLAGGAARRLGGVPKPALPVAGRPMLDRVLAAVADAAPRIVVGPPDLVVPAGVLLTREEPPGGGPVAGAAAGLALVPPDVDEVALLAADLPLLTPEAVAVLRHWLAGARPAAAGAAAVDAASAGADAARAAAAGLAPAGPVSADADGSIIGVRGEPSRAGSHAADVAVYQDGDGRQQTLCGIWCAAALREALDRLVSDQGGLTGASMRALVEGVTVVGVAWSGTGPPPWFDCDTDADLRRAQEWAR